MIHIILLVLLSPFSHRTTAVAQFKPCVFPNRCGAAPRTEPLAQFKPCVFPNRCGAAPSLIQG